MKIKYLLEGVGSFKVKDSVKERLKKTLISYDIPIEGDVDYGRFYIHDGLAIPIESEDIFEALGVPEFPVEMFYNEIEKARRNLIEYEKGQILTATTENGTKLVFVNLEELYDGTLLGYGEVALKEGGVGICNEPVRYTKARCSKANAPEISMFLKRFKEATGISLNRTGSKVGLFKLRLNNQVYYYVDIVWKTGEVSIKKTHDQGHIFDDKNFEQGNYFESEQEAQEALKMLKLS